MSQSDRSSPAEIPFLRLSPVTRHLSLPDVPFPEKLRLALRLGDPAGQHEQGIAQAIEELENDGVDRLFARKSHADSFRRAANRPRLVQQPRNLAASRQDELFERSQVFLTFVDELFQTS